MFTFNKIYFQIALAIFTVEVIIAIFIKDSFIRPYFGDFLVVILIYCFIKSFIKAPVWALAAFVMLFSLTIESLQYFNFVDKIGLGKSQIAKTILGTSFAWKDISAYFLGILTILIFENALRKKKQKPSS